MASEIEQLHFLLIPLMSQSHIISLTDFAKLLAQHGPTVSIITTPCNATRHQPIIDHAQLAKLKIQFIPLQFPGQKFGLPEGCENMDELISPKLGKAVFDACAMLQEPLQKLIGELKPNPSCIISSNALPWTQSLAQKFGIPRYVFQTVSCFTLIFSRKIYCSGVQECLNSDLDSFLVPDVPHKIELTKSQLPYSGKETSNDLIDQMNKVQSLARGTLLNTFEELEPWYVKEYKKATNNVWCIGPVSLANKEVAEKTDRGSKSSIDGNHILEWLDSMKPNSVIYACFGSLSRLTPLQLREIGLGLEASGRPFIWIIRELDYSAEVEKWLKEYNFEGRVRGRIIRGWAPQVLILSHPSTGGFLTHCGWNSTLEGVCAGVPMITWPLFAEQFYNEKFIVDVLRVGVKVGSQGVMKFGEEENVLVKRGKIKQAIDQLMEEGEESQQRRKRARELGEKAKDAIEEGGSSYLNITLLIQDVMQLQANGRI